MDEFPTHLLFNIGHSFAWLENTFKDADSLSELRVKQKRDLALWFMDRLAGNLEKIDCQLSAKAARRLAKDISASTKPESIKVRAGELRYLIFDEMAEHLFFWVPKKRSVFHKDPHEFFGADVALKFHQARYDIEETAKCFATDRFTAAVLHSMRVLELGLAALARSLKVPHNEHTWQDLLNGLRGAWKKVENSPTKLRTWKRDRQFIAKHSRTLSS